MEQRKGLYVHSVRRAEKQLLRGVHKGKQAAVHQQNTLGSPRCSRGGQLKNDVVGIGRVSRITRRIFSQPLLVGRKGLLRTVDRNHLADAWHLVKNRNYRLDERRPDENDGGFGIVNDVAHFV